MRAMERQQSLIERPVPWIEVRRLPVIAGLAQGSAPRVRGLVRKAVGQAFRNLHIQRMITGVAQIAVQPHRRKLRIDDNEILRKPAVPDQAAGLACYSGLSIEGACELTHAAVGEECPEDGIAAKRCRSRNGLANDSRTEIE